MSIVSAPEKLATDANDGLMSKEDKEKLDLYPDTPATPVVTSVTEGNGLSLTAGVLAMASTVANWTVSTLATLAVVLTSLVRATGAALVMRSDLGASSSDVVTKLGSSVADGSVNSAAKLVSVRTGLGGTEVEKAYIDKTGKLWLAAELSVTRIIRDISAQGLWLVAQTANGVTQVLVESLNTLSSGALLGLQNAGTRVVTFDVSGRMDQAGTNSSGTPGAATIAKPIGTSAIAAGASSCVITNSLVAAGDWVMITPHARDSTCKELIAVTTANTITVSGSANATAALAFSWEVKKRI